MMHLQPSTIIIGLGNPILTDDGVGVLVARELARRLAHRPDIAITEASVGGLRLMEMMAGYDRAILIDAILDEHPPGTITRLTLADLAARAPTQHSASAHDVSLPTALEAGRRMGLHLPDDVIIYAVSVANVMDFSDAPTAAVADAIPTVVNTIIDEIKRFLDFRLPIS
jgi:hydrogenase maturation protease